ncbi:BnaC03g60680D [Brassica napus]|uniref:BnaC03g60680D protein n=1 Tax=Brassica napus TaxID=3708 RepID=A0A078HRS1_BRANA|nr:BnaC03g60680D [Brassica napus]
MLRPSPPHSFEQTIKENASLSLSSPTTLSLFSDALSLSSLSSPSRALSLFLYVKV